MSAHQIKPAGFFEKRSGFGPLIEVEPHTGNSVPLYDSGAVEALVAENARLLAALDKSTRDHAFDGLAKALQAFVGTAGIMDRETGETREQEDRQLFADARAALAKALTGETV